MRQQAIENLLCLFMQELKKSMKSGKLDEWVLGNLLVKGEILLHGGDKSESVVRDLINES